MSKRRKVGNWVWLLPNSGFIGESSRLRAEIRPGDPAPCFLCEDEECNEWPDLWTEPDPLNDNKRHLLCHVSECQMSDTKQCGKLDDEKRCECKCHTEGTNIMHCVACCNLCYQKYLNVDGTMNEEAYAKAKKEHEENQSRFR